jgi:CRISPR-associated protein Cas1
MQQALIINEFGTDLRLDHECLVVIDKDKNIQRKIPLMHLESVMVHKGMSMSTSLMQKLAFHQIPLFIQGDSQLPCVEIQSIAYVRKNQLFLSQLSWVQSQEAIETARAYIINKLEQQRQTLKKFNRRVQVNFDQEIEQVKQIIQKLQAKDIKTLTLLEIMGYEGAGAQIYWRCISQITPLAWEFSGRHSKQANDFFNLCLNYGYGIVKNYLKTICMQASLSFNFGFLHHMHHHENLLYDFIEIIRPIVDYALVVALKPIKEFSIRQSMLSDDTRKIIATTINQLLITGVEVLQKKMTIKQFLLENAYELAKAMIEKKSHQPKMIKV